MLGSGTLLRSKTPGLIQQEFHNLLLAHYAVRHLIHKTAGRAREGPDRLSFLHAMNVVLRWIIHPGALPSLRTTNAERDILEERVVSSRGQAKRCGPKRKLSNHPTRSREPRSRTVRGWTPQIRPISP